MSFASILRAGAKIVDRQTKSAQPEIRLFTYKSQTGTGTVTYTNSKGTPHRVVIEEVNETFKGPGGKELRSDTRITIPRKITVSPRDKIVFPDGSTRPILHVDGVRDPTGGRFITQIFMGAIRGQ